MKNLYDNVYLALFGRKFIKIAFCYDSVDWFGVSSVRRLTQQTILRLNLGRPKVEFGSSHEKFDVWPRPYSTSSQERKVGNSVIYYKNTLHCSSK